MYYGLVSLASIRFREEVPPPLAEAALSLLSRRKLSSHYLSFLRVPEGLKESQQGVEQVADEIRRLLGVCRGPVYNPVLAIDDAGVETYEWSHYGTNSVVSATLGCAIFRHPLSSDYEIVFEFASIVLSGFSYGKGVSMKDEAFARRVAGAVLLPKSEVQRELGTARPLGYVNERVVAYFAVKYRLEPALVLKRLVAAGVVMPMVADLVDVDKARRLAADLAQGGIRKGYLLDALQDGF